MPKTASDVEMVRVTVMLPVETAEQIKQWAANAGLKTGQFTSTALVIGSRHLARQLSPEDFLTPELVSGIVRASGATEIDISDAVRSGKLKVTL